MRLMITRPQADAEQLAARLTALGHEVVAEPLLHIRAVAAELPDLDQAQALLVTSANGIRAFAAATTRRDLVVLAVGEASAQAARDQGFAAVESAGGNVDSLARLTARSRDPKAGPLIHVAGTRLAGDLAGGLESLGFTVQRLVLYEAVPVAAFSAHGATALGGGNLDGILFFSPRTAKTFVNLARAAALENTCAEITAYCLSRQVATVIKDCGFAWRRVAVAPRPEQRALLSLLEESP